MLLLSTKISLKSSPFYSSSIIRTKSKSWWYWQWTVWIYSCRSLSKSFTWTYYYFSCICHNEDINITIIIFHSTDPISALNIAKIGFHSNLDTSQMLGYGIYFARYFAQAERKACHHGMFVRTIFIFLLRCLLFQVLWYVQRFS